MNFWIKYRFWIASGIFVLASIGALAMIYCQWPCDSNLWNSLSLAIIGLGFTLGQFYFQINENRYQKREADELQVKSDLRDSFRELVKSFSERIQNLNEVLGDQGETTFKRFLIEHTRFSNNIRQEYTLYVPMFFREVETLEEYKDFF